MSSKKLADALKMSDEEIESIYKDLLKSTEEDKQVNCRACGYDTCEQMVAAIAIEMKTKEDCARYRKIQDMIVLFDGLQANLQIMVKNLETTVEAYAVISRILQEKAEN